MRIRGPLPAVYVDATPSHIGCVDTHTGRGACAPVANFQSTNELAALLWAVRQHKRSRDYVTDAQANLSLCKRSPALLPAKLALGLLSPQVSWVPSHLNLADSFSRPGSALPHQQFCASRHQLVESLAAIIGSKQDYKKTVLLSRTDSLPLPGRSKSQYQCVF